ncbi:Uncharacterized protein ChrSV_1263 [Chromobacterium vaccinii]|nr:Uncharacterized protein ChrSW_1263 [Chromobacterium vaccinii]QND88721.1 Uncharacterized protein ChrSV_1263 [Chromobacterium vaccinii]
MKNSQPYKHNPILFKQKQQNLSRHDRRSRLSGKECQATS